LVTAELMFAERGYGALSLRAITRAAGVNLAAIHYHFGSKEELLERIFERRCGPMNQERLRRLRECREQPGRPPLLSQILDAYLRPSLIWPGEPDAARRFIRLRAMLSQEQEALARDLISRHFNDVSRTFVAALRDVLPDLPDVELYWRFQLLLSALYYTLSNPGRIAILSEGRCDPSDPDLALEHLVPLCAAVFLAPLSSARARPRRMAKRSETAEAH